MSLSYTAQRERGHSPLEYVRIRFLQQDTEAKVLSISDIHKEKFAR
jgi:hypothetical protein